jgi:hypothetical protein
LDLHLAAFAVEGMEAGIYRPDLIGTGETGDLSWKLTKRGDFRDELRGIGLGQDIAGDGSFALLYTADMAALVAAYGDRGYRYACLDAGQLGERIQLWAVHRDLGSSGIGGYYDDWGNRLLELPLSHGLLYITVAGVPEE